MRRPADRLAGLVPSPIRALARGAPDDAISLGLGEPTWPLPEAARRALAAQTGACSYGPNAGLPELRRAIGRRHDCDEHEVLVTCGSQEAMFCLLHAWVGPGDTVLVPDPGFPAYSSLATLAGATAATYRLARAEGYRLAPGPILERLDDPGVKAVIIGHPANPTGAGADEEALRRVAQACAERDVLLISDEVYRQLHFGVPIASLRDVSNHGVVVDSVSKGWGAPGMRVGWAVGEPRWLEPAELIHGFAVTAASRPGQLAALALLEASDTVLPAGREELAIRWRTFAGALREHLEMEVLPPEGGFYFWMPIPAGEEDSMAVALSLRDDAHVVVVPGEIFGDAGRRHLRLSFAASPGDLQEGIRRLASCWSAGAR